MPPGSLARPGTIWLVVAACLVLRLATLLTASAVVSHDEELLPLVLYPVMFSFTYATSSLSVYGARDESIFYAYFAPLFLFAALGAGVLVERWAGARWLVGSLLVLRAVGQIAMAGREPVGRALHYRGYSYQALGERWQSDPARRVETLTAARSVLDCFPPRERRAIAWAVFQSPLLTGEAIDPARLRLVLAEVPRDHHADVLETLGVGLAGVGARSWTQIRGLDVQIEHVRDDGFEHEAPRCFLASSPSAFWRRPRRDPASVPAEHRADFAWGVGWGVRSAFRDDRTRVLDWLRAALPDSFAAALSGVESAERWYSLDERD